jgi:GxxExxY protein
MTELLFKEEVFLIVGAAMEVYNQLGNGFLEGVYQEALVMEFGLRGIPFQAQALLHITYKGRVLEHQYVPDFVVYDQIIIELKAIKAIGANEEAQLLNYLKASGLRVGLLLNFGAERRLEWSRFVL